MIASRGQPAPRRGRRREARLVAAAARRLAHPAADRGLRRARPEDVLADRPDVAAALQGTPATRTRHTRDGRAVVDVGRAPDLERRRGAPAPWWPRRPPTPSMSVHSARARAAGAAHARRLRRRWRALLIAFATRLSMRIRRLRDEAESAIDARGRIVRASPSGSRRARRDRRPVAQLLGGARAPRRSTTPTSRAWPGACRTSCARRSPWCARRSRTSSSRREESRPLYIERAERACSG